MEATAEMTGGTWKAFILYGLFQGPHCPKSSCVPLDFLSVYHHASLLSRRALFRLSVTL